MPRVLRAAPFATEVGSVRKARALVRDFLEDLALPEAVQLAVLLTSELATAAVLGSSRVFFVSASLAAAWLRVSISDEDHRFPGLEEERAGSVPDEFTIVECIATEWGVDATETGRYMWFELDLLSPDVCYYCG